MSTVEQNQRRARAAYDAIVAFNESEGNSGNDHVTGLRDLMIDMFHLMDYFRMDISDVLQNVTVGYNDEAGGGARVRHSEPRLTYTQATDNTAIREMPPP